MPPCGRRWQGIWPSTGACSATRSSWWWAQDWNICWGCWPRFCPAPLPWRPPATPRARQVLENNGVPCRCLPVDADGLSLTALSASDAAVCYVTPSHQFPTGVTMPAGRRAELLHWAARAPGRRYIIEDDYDSEFRFDTRPLPSLQGMAGADGPVVYLSTCSRSLAPGIRIAYMVLPPAAAGRMAGQVPAVLRHGRAV